LLCDVALHVLHLITAPMDTHLGRRVGDVDLAQDGVAVVGEDYA
jgi:hypothetical protein